MIGTVAAILICLLPGATAGLSSSVSKTLPENTAGQASSGTPVRQEAPAIVAGREALDHWGRYPWYDAENDAVRRIDVAPPEVGFWEWLLDLLPDFNWSLGGGSSGSTLGCLLRLLAFSLIAAAALALVYFLVRAFLKQKPFDAEPSAAGSGGKHPKAGPRVEDLPFAIAPDMSNLLEAARHYCRRGEYGEAAKYLFSHQLVQLDRCNMIRLARGKTNRQYLRELGRGHALHDYVAETMRVFEEFFFGNRTIQRPQFEACWSGVELFQAHLASAANKSDGKK